MKYEIFGLTSEGLVLSPKLMVGRQEAESMARFAVAHESPGSIVLVLCDGQLVAAFQPAAVSLSDALVKRAVTRLAVAGSRVPKKKRSSGLRRKCSEGGVCEMEPDIEYDSTGDTINCVKCGES